MRSAAGSRPRPSPEAPLTARRALAAGAARLERAGVDTPRLDAEVLLAHALGRSRAEVLAAGSALLPQDVRGRFESALLRRERREPVAYITASRGFRRLELAVDRRVLVPRPETELLVEVALALAPRGARVCDVGTGSGAVALALADERPDLAVSATDSSEAALAVARANAARLGLAVRLVRADLLEGVEGRLELVVANLPYVAEGELGALMPEVSCHEPRAALAAGPDGLGEIRRLVDQAAAREVPLLALEVGAGQASEVAALLRRRGWSRVEVHPDLAGIERVVAGRR